MTQDKAFAVLISGANVFLTGEPGSGKTHTILRYIEYLRNKNIAPAITASTGIAATHIGGMTIHAWSGIGIKRKLTREDARRLKTNKRVAGRVLRTEVLIIDEISMLDADTLSSVDTACRAIKERDEPFGGMQVVFVGDFFQLPPIPQPGEDVPGFAFQSLAWEEANPLICYLSEQHRQEDDEFLSLLSSVRSGDVSDEIREELASRRIELQTHTTPHTILYSHNADVDSVNSAKLSAIPEQGKLFFMRTNGPKALVAQIIKGCLSPETLALKVGARVMFTKNNFEEGYVNGTLGVVAGFAEESGYPVIRTTDGKRVIAVPDEWSIADGMKILAMVKQVPLRLAWAITVHKSQGMTLDAAVVDLRGAFAYGQGYVALSRVRAFSGLFLLGYNERALEVHPDILEIDADFRAQSRATEQAFGD
jgi:ATP-dependent exoDNAse (exonuclease V) alpha subunit